MERLKFYGSFLLIIMFFGIFAFSAEKIKPVPEEKLKEILKKAPLPPKEEIDLGLKMRLIDYIDCTDPNDPHDFMDQGTSKIVSGKAGKYRITAPHRHAFFSYGYKTDGPDKPVLIVVEYPDDDIRKFSIMTHDSMRPARPHVSFSQEAGVYTGYPLPNTNKMRYFTLLNWPQDNWSPLLIVNFSKYGGGGVASRIWVFAVDEINPPEISAPDPDNQRKLEMFFPLAFLAKRDNFGWQSPKSIEHMVDYCKMVGINRVTMMCYANQSWGGMVSVPSWDVPSDNGYLDDILTQMDRKGGVDLIVGIVADGMYGDIKSGGKIVRTLPKEEIKNIIIKGIDEIIDKYGNYKSFKGFAFGSMEANGFFETLKEAGIVNDVISHIKARRPDFTVLTFIGNAYLQTPFFQPFVDNERNRSYPTPTTYDLIFNWEKTGDDWQKYIADTIYKDWITWGYNPKEILSINGLTVYEKYLPDDHKIIDSYRSEPRAMIYYDVLHCEGKSKYANTPYAGIFSTFDEGWLGLSENYNFWYGKWWTAPDFNATSPFSILPWTISLSHNDRLGIMAGAWSVKYFGHENTMRKFAKAFRSLPPVIMEDVDTIDSIKARWIFYKGKRYISIINKTPFDINVSVDGKQYKIQPYQLEVVIDSVNKKPDIKATQSKEYQNWVLSRINNFRNLINSIREIDKEAAPDVYSKVADEAEKLLKDGKVYSSDLKLAYGLENELSLRYSILNPPKFKAPKVSTPPQIDGDVSDWSKEASEYIINTGEYLQTNNYFPNSWFGPDDLSAKIKFCNDGKNLYFGIEITDDKILPKGDFPENLIIWLSPKNYKNWKEKDILRPEYTFIFRLIDRSGKEGNIFDYVSKVKDNKFILEGYVPLNTISSKNSTGFMLMYNDCDDAPSMDRRKGWAKKQVLTIPHQPKWAIWGDSRNCGEIIIE